MGLNNQLSDTELHHLIEFSKILENNVRRIARLEDDEIAQKEFECLFTGKMKLCEDGSFLDKAMDLLDSKFVIVSKIGERRVQDLEMKLSSKVHSSELDKINSVLIQFGFNLQQNIQPQAELVNSAAQKLSKLRL